MPRKRGTSHFVPLRMLWLLVFYASVTVQGQEWRGFWAAGWHPGFRDSNQVSQLIADVRAANCNAVFVQVRRRGESCYNDSPFEPKDKWISPAEFDPLADIIAKAHNTNIGPRIEVHAWFVAYPIATRAPVNPNAAPEPIPRSETDPNHPFALHPDWLTRSEKGDDYDGLNYSFDPGHPKAQEHIFNVAMDVISRYDVDGFHLDHAHYASPAWGYNPVAVERFNAHFSRSGSPPKNDPEWMQFRRDQVTALVRKIYISAIAIKPSIKISAATFTSVPSGTSDAIWAKSAPYQNYFQDWRAWMEEGILDMNVPMNFFRQATAGYARDYANWCRFAEDHKYNHHVVIGPAIYENSVSNAMVQIRQAREATPTGNHADGVSLYSYAKFSSEDVPRAVFLDALTRTRSSEQVAPPVFERPVVPPEMPWKTKPTRGHLKGFVFGGSRTNALDGASVILASPKTQTLLSDGTGFYGAVGLVPGDYTLMTRFPGFQPSTNHVTVVAGKVSSEDIVLEAVKAK